MFVAGALASETAQYRRFLIGGAVVITIAAGLLGQLGTESAFPLVAVEFAVLGVGVGMIMHPATFTSPAHDKVREQRTPSNPSPGRNAIPGPGWTFRPGHSQRLQVPLLAVDQHMGIVCAAWSTETSRCPSTAQG
ncbi:hypothetical protein [Nocardia cyriacigeorgica]|uniref:hypothetical protein n=1 Tax=Nocardia cyriacigeorgica TaxID=135487 RepID=UPI00245445CA|nr:hypothetical protein [Nocardia cyriacigeorgica]